MRKNITIKKEHLLIGSMLYLILPMVIFFTLWTKIYFAIPALLVLTTSMIVFMNNAEKEENDLTLSLWVLIVTIIFIILIGIICGWGDIVRQTGDWIKHNALIADLTYMDYPVYYTDATTPSMLSYYIGHYLVPCLIGKIFHSAKVSEFMFLVWSCIGLFLIVLHIYSMIKCKDKYIFTIVEFLLFFGSCHVISLIIMTLFKTTIFMSPAWTSIYHWVYFSHNNPSIMLNYRSNYASLAYVAPQCISVWLTTAIWMKHRKEISTYLPLMITCMLTGVLSFLGMAVIVVISLIIDWFKEKTEWKVMLKRIFSKYNVLTLIFVAIPLLLYYSGNILQEKPKYIGFRMQELTLMIYIAFVIGVFGLWVLVNWKTQRWNTVFIATIIFLLILPFFKLGMFNDLNMSGSTPGMFILMVLSLQTFLMGKTWQKVCLAILLLISSMGPLKEMQHYTNLTYSNAENETHVLSSLAEYSDLISNKDDSYIYNYYCYDLNNVFIKYIAKNQP